MGTSQDLTLTVRDMGERHFDVVATNRDGFEVGRVEGSYGPDYLPMQGGNALVIGNCWVVRSHRKQGIGRAMVAAALAEAVRRYRAQKVCIEIAPQDGATLAGVRRFWESSGFVADADALPRAGRPRMVRTLSVQSSLGTI